MKQKKILLPKIRKVTTMHYCLCKKKGQGVRMYRSKSVEILAKNKTITYCECESKKLVIRNVWQT